ncbi:precorrin-8X methylmutase, partial [Pseudomonas aeruginosa]|uniref:precorrin-8X methylmutase n=1 Tax=Pseudomonas aeruginosa TaxID=287 RepID=UPI0021BD6520
MIDYIRDGQAIYRQSFATIRAEANLAGIPADLEKLAVRVIHACGMVDVVDDLRFSPGAGAAGRAPRADPGVGLGDEHDDRLVGTQPVIDPGSYKHLPLPTIWSV